LLLRPDHYLFRMLYSQGVALEDLGIGPAKATYDPRKAWGILAETGICIGARPRACGRIGCFRKCSAWAKCSAENADFYFDTITDQLATDAFRPRALFDRYNIEVIATTESPLDSLEHHAAIMAENAAGGWQGRVVTAYRPDPVVDPEFEGFRDNLKRFSEITGEDCLTWAGYLPRTASAAPFSPPMARPAPTTATPPRRPPTSRRLRPRPCSTGGQG
jgi:glucuronate isomerase